MKKFLIAYDIPNPKRLQEISKIAYSHSFGGQKSAVVSYSENLTPLITELNEKMKKEDKINIIEIEEAILLGTAKELDFQKGVIFL